jgi:hypothetical protein
MRKMYFEAAMLGLALTAVAIADDPVDPNVVLDSAIEAHGGESALNKFVGMYFEAKGTEYEGDNKSPVRYKWYIVGNDKMRTEVFKDGDKLTEVEVVNGKDGWVKDADGPTEDLVNEQLDSRREVIYASWVTTLTPLKAKGFHLSFLGDTPVAGSKAVGILVSHDGHDAIKLYFDKDTHLLVKYQRKFKNVEAGKDIIEESVYSDYRKVQQTMQPFKVETSWDGVRLQDLTAVEMKMYDNPPDDKLFSKP